MSAAAPFAFLLGLKKVLLRRTMARVYGCDVRCEMKPWGEPFTLGEIEAALRKHEPRAITITHGETTTGLLQPMDGIGDLCRAEGRDCLLLLDTVSTLGGVPTFLDAWGVDAAWSAGQKALGSVPGLSPITFSDRAMARMKALMKARAPEGPPTALDMRCWFGYLCGKNGKGAADDHKYCTTGPISQMYGLRAALVGICCEGLANVWARHAKAAEVLWDGLDKLGLEQFVAERSLREPTLTAVKMPSEVQKRDDGAGFCAFLNTEFGMQITPSGSTGRKKDEPYLPLEPQASVWRIGLMGVQAAEDTAAT